MARRRRMVAPINSIKHYVSRTSLSIVNGTLSTVDLVEGVSAAAAGANAQDVEEGALVKAVFVELWIFCTGALGSSTQFVVTLEKVPNNAPQMTFTNSLNLGSYPNKKNIFYTTQGILPSFQAGANAVPIIRSWMLIPKGKQRIGLSDKISLNMSTTGQNLQVCGIFTYKEYK